VIRATLLRVTSYTLHKIAYSTTAPNSA